MSRLVLFATAAAVAAIIAASAASCANQQPEAPPALLIATEGAFAPWNATTADGKLVGFEIDLANDLCHRMRVRCAIVAQDWTSILPGLQQGRYDAVMAGVTVTTERAEAMDLVAPMPPTPRCSRCGRAPNWPARCPIRSAPTSPPQPASLSRAAQLRRWTGR